MKRKDCFWIVAVAVLLLSSCSSSKKFVYLQDMEMGLGYPYDTRYAVSFKHLRAPQTKHDIVCPLLL